MRQLHLTSIICALIVSALPFAPAHADGDTEARLREALRSAITQVRSLEDQQAALSAKQAEDGKQNEALRLQVQALEKQLGENHDQARPAKKNDQDQAAYQQAVAEFNQKLSAQNEAIGKMGETLDKWKAAYNEAVAVARAKETERAQLAGKVDGLARQAESCEAKNEALFKIGNEILERYATVGIGEAFGASEPFIGMKRVELQNAAQDYQDKLLDQKASP
jgi:chromosome segregation ATPase